MGTHVTYTPELGAAICARLAAGTTITNICSDVGMPDRVTVWRWAKDDPAFAAMIEHARQAGFDVMAEEMLNIADDGSNDFVEKKIHGEDVVVFDAEHVQRSKLRVDTRKWYLSKLSPRQFGDRVTVEHDMTSELIKRMSRAQDQ